MVIVIQAIPKHEHSVDVHLRYPSETTHKARCVRRLPLLYLIQHFRPSVDIPAGDTLFDPTLTDHGPALRLRSFLRPMRRHGGVYDCQCVLPLLDTLVPHPPPTTNLSMATDL